MIIML